LQFLLLVKFLWITKIKKDAETIGSAEEKARGIIDEALKTAETKKRELYWK